jgi:hypothetical protein
MVTSLLLAAALLAGAGDAPAGETAPELRTLDVVRNELASSRDALRSALQALDETRGADPGSAERHRRTAERIRVRIDELQAERDRIREIDDRIAEAGLPDEDAAELRELLAALRAKGERERIDVAAARADLARATTRSDLTAAETRLTRAERAHDAARLAQEELIGKHLPQF